MNLPQHLFSYRTHCIIIIQASAREIELDERMTYCRHMAAWLLHEKNYNQIVNKLKALRFEPQSFVHTKSSKHSL